MSCYSTRLKEFSSRYFSNDPFLFRCSLLISPSASRKSHLICASPSLCLSSASHSTITRQISALWRWTVKIWKGRGSKESWLHGCMTGWMDGWEMTEDGLHIPQYPSLYPHSLIYLSSAHLSQLIILLFMIFMDYRDDSLLVRVLVQVKIHWTFDKFRHFCRLTSRP